MLIGYARNSTGDQNLALQRDAFTAAGCERIFTDEGVSGSVTARRALDAALAALGPYDTLIVWKLDRLGRSLSHLVTLIAELGARGVNFRSLSDPIDTASSGGRLVMHTPSVDVIAGTSGSSEHSPNGTADAQIAALLRQEQAKAGGYEPERR